MKYFRASARGDQVAPAKEIKRLGTLDDFVAVCRNAAKDAMAGVVASVVLIANIVSFGALMFQGEFSGGIPIAIWAMLIGSCAGGIWIALTTSLPPLATGIDSPTGAVLVLLSATIGSSILAAGATPEAAIQSVMLIFTGATFLTGVLLYALGAFKLGTYFRFVPYFVVGGFLAATGCFLVAGGVRMAAGQTSLREVVSNWTPAEAARLMSSVVVLFVLLVLRRWVKTAVAMPVALVAMWVIGGAVLHSLGLSAPKAGWYLRSLGTLSQWVPFEAVRKSHLTWSMMPSLVLELLAVTIVALISLVTKVSSIEVARQAAGDLDREFRSHGIASLLAAPLGGITSSLQVGTSRLLEHAGGATRMSGVACALALGAVGMANFDLPGLVPIPIIAGLVFYLGYSFIVDALWRPISQRAWLDFSLAVAITIVCTIYGYLIGVIAGLVCACVMFAVSYARLGVIRRHVTRSQFTSHVSRSIEAARYLRESGDSVQIYWLSGYIFFGSSEGVFERIRADIDGLLPRRVEYVILDFGMVSGADSSAVVSLTKLRNYCGQQGITLIYCSLSPGNRAALERGGFFGGKSQHRAFVDLNHALAWCEDQLLAGTKVASSMDVAGFELWLQQQLGPSVKSGDLLAYLEQKNIDSPQILYREGEPADTLDLVAAGHLAIDVADPEGSSLRVRRIATQSVVGEMGFFRRTLRSATVSSDGATVLFTLTRGNFERMRRERPDLASAFDDFVMRVLADRLDFANRELAAIEPLVGSSPPRLAKNVRTLVQTPGAPGGVIEQRGIDPGIRP